MYKKIISLILVFVISGQFLHTNNVSGAECADVLTLFARGSSQNPVTAKDREEMGIDRSGKLINPMVGDKFIHVREDLFKKVEPESAAFFENVGTQIKSNFPDLSQEFISLHNFELKYNDFGYEAVSAFGSASHGFISRNAIDAKFGSNELIDDLTYGDYRQSVKNGAEELTGFLTDRIAECPNQIIVLGGFSQGAHVVGDALARMQSLGKEKELSRLGSVMLFGDPKFNGYKLETSRLNPAARYHTEQPWVRGALDRRSVGSLGPREPYVPAIITDKIGSWCDYQDVVCSGASGLVGGVKNFDVQAHGSVYRNAGGYIEQAAKEVFFDLQSRLAFISSFDVVQRRSSTPVYRKKVPIDVMFVFDTTNDNDKNLVPDFSYLYNNFAKLRDEYALAKVGIVSFTEQDTLIAGQYYTTPVSKIVHPLDDGVLDTYSVLTTQWANERFKKFTGGVDVEDSPYTPLLDSLNQSWRPEAKKLVLYFTGSYGKNTEPYTGLQAPLIAEYAKQKGVEIVPVFTSRKFSSSGSLSPYVEPARIWHQQFADLLGNGWVELPSALPEDAIYDIIMGRLRAPRVEGVSVGYGQDITKPFAVGEPIVLSVDAYDPDSAIDHYEWDLDGDKVFEEKTVARQLVHEPTELFGGSFTVRAVSSDGAIVESSRPIVIEENSNNRLKQIETPLITHNRTGDSLLIEWSPFEGVLILRNDIGMQIFLDGTAGRVTLSGVPLEEFGFSYQASSDDGISGEVRQTTVNENQKQQNSTQVRAISIDNITQEIITTGQQATAQTNAIESSSPAIDPSSIALRKVSTNVDQAEASNDPNPGSLSQYDSVLGSSKDNQLINNSISKKFSDWLQIMSFLFVVCYLGWRIIRMAKE